MVVALIFAALLGVEWRTRLAVVRLGTAILALVVLLVAQPNYTTAARRVSVAPPGERVTMLRGSPISEYESGVATMVEAIDEAGEERAGVRMLAVGVLFWLACSPVLRGARDASAGDATGRGLPEGDG